MSVVHPQDSTHSLKIPQAVVISADRIVNSGAVASGGGVLPPAIVRTG